MSKCVICGYEDVRALQFDHIDGGGNRHRKNGSLRAYYKYYANRPELARQTFQVLCANCNWIKKSENKEGLRK